MNWRVSAISESRNTIASQWLAPATVGLLHARLRPFSFACGMKIPEAKLGLVTDIWNPGPPVRESNPGLASVIHAVDKLGLNPVKFAGGQGNVGDYAQAEKVVKLAEKK
jgi:hypothetical protein